jgi:hypothetical protein
VEEGKASESGRLERHPLGPEGMLRTMDPESVGSLIHQVMKNRGMTVLEAADAVVRGWPRRNGKRP